jgi:hypothetical protein
MLKQVIEKLGLMDDLKAPSKLRVFIFKIGEAMGTGGQDFLYLVTVERLYIGFR